jgi:chromosome segregation protein
MRVSRLQLQGFKSFASKAELELGPGITAVVGPNGSGKSNLVDAIRLVLGSANARDLRGQRLEQVIFGGGERRAALGMAEVTIVFDNEDSRLPVDDIEVAISRRVFRDGTSEFRRNGSRVRLRDLARLLDATGLTQAGYAVIAQNDIESIIKATPLQRRHLVEEAAGVRGAQALIDESWSRLQALDQWLEGSMGRLVELLPRIDALRAEAATADDALSLRGRLGQLRGSLERAAWLGAVAEAQRTERQLPAGLRRQEQAAQQFADYDRHYTQQRQVLRQAQSGRLNLERRVGELALRLQQFQSAAERWLERAQQAASSREAVLAQLREVADDLTSLGLGNVGASEEQEGPRIEALQQRRHEMEMELSYFEGRREELRSVATAKEASSSRLRIDVGELRRRRAEAASRLQAASGRLERSSQAAVELREGVEVLRNEVGQAQERCAESGRLVEGTASELATAVRSEAAALEVLRQAEVELSRVTAADREAAAQAAAQAAIVDGRRQGHPIAEAAGSGTVRLHQLSSSLRPGVEADATAIEAGLGSLAAALVGSEAEVRDALALAGEAAEVLCWPAGGDHASSSPVPAGCRPLAGALRGSAQDLEVVSELCRGVCLAESRPAAAAWLSFFPEGRAVLPDGTVVGRGLEITPASAEGDIRAIQRLDLIRTECRRQTAQREQAERHLEWARGQHQLQRSRVDDSRRRSSEAAGTVEVSRAQEQRLGERLHEQLQRLAQAERELEREGRHLEQGGGELFQLDAEIERIGLLLGGDVAAATSLKAEFEGLVAPEGVDAGALEQLRLEISELELAARAQARLELEQARRRSQLIERRQAAGQRLGLAEGNALVALVMAEQSRTATDAAGLELAEREAQSQSFAASAEDPLQQLAEMERARSELETASNTAGAYVTTLERQLEELRERARQLKEQLAPELAEAGEPSSERPGDPERAAHEIGRLERRLAALGPVNELAPTQLAELLERTEGLRTAHEDTVQARHELELVMSRLQTLSNARFRSTLALVTREFELVWKELFGGGRATLVLTEADRVERAGIDLEVQPQGKRVMPMPLLSGGERALTALALVLALQEVSPSPFYVFDEVDAALDEVNVANFVRLIQSRAARSQFLVVTHSLTTMAMASQLYGVTLDGRGSSRVLSVRLAEDGQSIEEESLARPQAVLLG